MELITIAMKTTVLILVCFVPFCFGGQNGFLLYKSKSLSGGHQCGINDELFIRQVSTFSRCLFECNTHTLCKQFFYIQDRTSCIGCSSLKMQPASHFNVTERYVRQPIYMGCFEDQVARILNGHNEVYGLVTNEICAELCLEKGFKYAGTQVGEECYCGNEYDAALRPDHECSHTCDGDQTQYCGSDWRMSIYLTY